MQLVLNDSESVAISEKCLNCYQLTVMTLLWNGIPDEGFTNTGPGGNRQ